MIRFIALVIVSTLAGTLATHAQDSRAEALKREREEKEQAAEPYQPNFLETALKTIERSGVPLDHPQRHRPGNEVHPGMEARLADAGQARALRQAVDADFVPDAPPSKRPSQFVQDASHCRLLA